ncbi:RNA polymerase sigma factor [Bacteroides sp.]|uniref:RNA polymerase sigma factor n=1 Tax=Bacteroides sp. TaxID=29523 RepID=UPI0026102A20|nr:RNA polymerase sigma factor [Bacteroides sp.]MDD3038887.1 RNA polymerase sigma factor [Bacteroides sp.]
MDFDKELSEIYPWILRMARKYCRTREDAEDLAGDTVYRLLINRDKFDCSRSLKPWCVVIMENLYITMYNRKSIINFVCYDMAMENISSCNASDLTLFHEVLAGIRRCFEKTKCIDCMIYFSKGYSYKEISEFLNIPIGTVKSRISYDRKKLYKELNL